VAEIILKRREAATAGLLWLLILCVVAWAYWPGLQGPLLLDDFSNLATLDKLELQGDFAVDVVIGNASGPLGRPLSMASFVVESLYLDYGVPGQKRLGLFIHLLNGCLVLLLCLRLLRAAGIQRPLWFAGLTAGLWLSAPLLLSTTLYVVQRMTLLAAMFSLIALCAYCVARDNNLEGKRSLRWWSLALASTICAALSKENGLLTLPMMTAMEVFIYGFRGRRPELRRLLQGGHALVLVVPVLGLLTVLVLRPELALGGYSIRDFSLAERLLTETRVLWMYLTQLFWPDLHSMGLYQDDVLISRGLLQPLSTLFALGGWLLVLLGILASAIRRRGRLLAFGFSFFLVGHALESTVFPLELYFEHRNYLPSVGIWFALVALCAQLQQRWPPLRDWLLAGLAFVLLRSIVSLGSQAVIWSDLHLVSMEAANYHPQSPRALLELAQVYARDQNLDGALELMNRVPLSSRGGELEPALLRAIYHCTATATIPESLLGDLRAQQSHLSDSHVGENFHHLIKMVIDGKCPGADATLLAEQLRNIMEAEGLVRGSPKIYAAMILLENHLQRYTRGLEYANLLLARQPESVLGLQFQLYFATILELEDQRKDAENRLRALRDAGRLSRQESYNLGLFLDRPE
jgi:hypothetical protein